ncbi:MAG: bifunctional phosphoribosylaminoimidazolecarboxamide formyltransferase/IMP cyclohydrolase [Omnitrophica WOR_2 bacterium GWA2_63_20]|nr:MAG: bifunctional phosphoribosylaminoimidazolecarboxamide formyltransferase/IMP cyclohydrolase [Omnitrophica WOR_2 bacterium GWA2_63_20]OGX16626.1 MAG: bifunctional phosphoribosylaminoimidazolecarboxamide formyltransferase/IMP cyclohydrolase [Omnitrophica WOR_2 bacterium GWF2_63_9]OGX47033.1 MAG: bifunctional phosphoribosylaminoimidazolecarboxamide formyltransferase/IMP cyclohydrolase [Omnitrophica WOR_2 bacterium RIFCSPLOWO2_12_FULL_63_16]HAM40878.1 bifunctional phosphoribosylaminoimidazolec
MVTVTRALLSCHDKAGLDVFAKGLRGLGVELVASGGTAAFVQQHGLQVVTVEAFAGIAEQLDGRVKTLHPAIHAGILANRADAAHLRAVGTERLIDLVVVNLYPFEETTRRPETSLGEAIEEIDIGGVALLRGAAKNFQGVAAVSDPSQYPTVLKALQQGKGVLPQALSRELSVAAFALTSRYDASIAAFLSGSDPLSLPSSISLAVHQHQGLRYGENPHQHSAWYVPSGTPPRGLTALTALQGKALSYNNLVDVDAVVRCLREFERPTCVIVKHASPCGVASDETIQAAFQRAHDGDAESAFGGIVGFNRPLDVETATRLQALFLEVIAAPSIPDAVRSVFAEKPNLRLIELAPSAPSPSLEWRSIEGGWLVQTPDRALVDPSALRVVTKVKPTASQQCDALFAWACVKHVKSNAVVLANRLTTVGIGQGQPSRVRAVRLAIQHAGVKCRGAAMASDGFFPFPDSVTLAAQAGVRMVIQPGGSLKDAEVIAAADHAGVAMVFTGTRHFRH